MSKTGHWLWFSAAALIGEYLFFLTNDTSLYEFVRSYAHAVAVAGLVLIFAPRSFGQTKKALSDE